MHENAALPRWTRGEPRLPVRPAGVVEITDTGIGIDPQLMPRIFDMFTQLERSSDGRRAASGSD